MTRGGDIVAYGLFLTAFSLYKCVELFNPSLPYLHSYLEDFLAIPIVLKSAQLIIRVFIPKQKQYAIALRDTLLVTAVFAVYFEVYLPLHDPRFTADILDVVAYTLGAFAFWQFLNQHTTATTEVDQFSESI